MTPLQAPPPPPRLRRSTCFTLNWREGQGGLNLPLLIPFTPGVLWIFLGRIVLPQRAYIWESPLPWNLLLPAPVPSSVVSAFLKYFCTTCYITLQIFVTSSDILQPGKSCTLTSPAFYSPRLLRSPLFPTTLRKILVIYSSLPK